MIRRIVTIRHWWRNLSVLAVLAAVWWKLPVTFCAARLGIVQLICPLGFLEASLATGSLVVRMLPGALMVALWALLFGRAFCTWTCPARLTSRAAEHLSHRMLPGPAQKIRRFWRNARQRIHRSLGLGWGDGLSLMAGLFLGVAIFGFPAYSIFCPVGVLSRNLIEMVAHFNLRWDLLFLLLPLIIGLFFNLGWKCACPVGLIHGVMATPNRTLIPFVTMETCGLCGKCVQNCAFGVSLHKNGHDGFKCAKCFKCLRDCDRDSVDIKLLARRKHVMKSEREKNQLVQSMHDDV